MTRETGANINEVLAQELYKLVIKKFKRRKVNSKLRDSIWAADLVEMGSLSSFNNVGKYLLSMVDVFTKYAFVKPLADKKDKTVLDGFIGIVNESKYKSNKLWVDWGKLSCTTKLMQKWLDYKDVLMYLTYSEGTSVVAERFIKWLNGKTYDEW